MILFNWIYVSFPFSIKDEPSISKKPLVYQFCRCSGTPHDLRRNMLIRMRHIHLQGKRRERNTMNGVSLSRVSSLERLQSRTHHKLSTSGSSTYQHVSHGHRRPRLVLDPESPQFYNQHKKTVEN
jgi:hypothetical protein